MKKLFSALFFIGLLFSGTACTPDNVNEDTELATDKDKVCPPNDRDCDPTTPQ